MKVTVVSVFANAVGYLERYFEQMDELQKLLIARGDILHLVLGYGDSGDGTGAALYDETVNRFDTLLLDVSHGGRVYESIVSKRRFKQLAKIANTLWGALPKDNDKVLYVESDLIWRGDTLLSLLDAQGRLQDVSMYMNATTLLAPMIMASNGLFYDVWAFRMSGHHFTAEIPYAPAHWISARYWEVDSVGSCFVLDYALAKQLTWPEEDVVVGLCRQVRELGANILVDSKLEVYHP